MGAFTAIQLAFVASTTVLIIHSTPSHLGHQRRGELPARAVVHTHGIDPGTAAARAAGDARHQATLARPTAFVPPSRPASPRDVFGQLRLSVEPNVGQASDGVQLVARGRGDASGDLILRLEDADEGRRVQRALAFPECLMPRNSCRSSIEN